MANAYVGPAEQRLFSCLCSMPFLPHHHHLCIRVHKAGFRQNNRPLFNKQMFHKRHLKPEIAEDIEEEVPEEEEEENILKVSADLDEPRSPRM